MVNEEAKSRQYCEMALNLSFRSLSEINYIVYHDRKLSKSIACSDTIRFYQFTLHYMFVMEICKLMEFKISDRKENFASLKRFNKQVSNLFGQKYHSTFEKAEVHLDELRKSTIYLKIIKYRDKELAHSDKDQVNGPLHFKGFNEKELVDCVGFLESLKDIFNQCLSIFDSSFGFPPGFKTNNFLVNYDEYKAYASIDRTNFQNWKQKYRSK